MGLQWGHYKQPRCHSGSKVCHGVVLLDEVDVLRVLRRRPISVGIGPAHSSEAPDMTVVSTSAMCICHAPLRLFSFASMMPSDVSRPISVGMRPTCGKGEVIDIEGATDGTHEHVPDNWLWSAQSKDICVSLPSCVGMPPTQIANTDTGHEPHLLDM